MLAKLFFLNIMYTEKLLRKTEVLLLRQLTKLYLKQKEFLESRDKIIETFNKTLFVGYEYDRNICAILFLNL